MAESLFQRYEQLQVESLLARYPGLRIRPSRGHELVIAGTLHFHVVGPAGEVIEDEYEVELFVLPGFPEKLPAAWETGDRIPADHHKLANGALCLGAPTEIRLALKQSPTLLTWLEGFVIPYLYGYSFQVKHGDLPYGGLDHGDKGIRQYLSALFGVKEAAQPEEFLRLAGMKKRHANKKPCACGSGRRLGRCHNRTTNALRKSVGRQWFRKEYGRVIKLLDSFPRSKQAD